MVKLGTPLKFYEWLVKEKHDYRAILHTIDIADGNLHHMVSLWTSKDKHYALHEARLDKWYQCFEL